MLLPHRIAIMDDDFGQTEEQDAETEQEEESQVRGPGGGGTGRKSKSSTAARGRGGGRGRGSGSAGRGKSAGALAECEIYTCDMLNRKAGSRFCYLHERHYTNMKYQADAKSVEQGKAFVERMKDPDVANTEVCTFARENLGITKTRTRS